MWVASLDGHNKLCDYQNSTFPLGVYGCLDTFYRKVLFFFLCFSKFEPELIGKNYLKYLSKSKLLPYFLRVDRGAVTGKINSIHAFLSDRVCSLDDPLNSIVYGPSTSNTIARFWRDLYHILETFFTEKLHTLLERNEYNPHKVNQRHALADVFLLIIQRECDTFVDLWNPYKVRSRNNLELPNGVPNHMFSFPEQYGGTQKGIPCQYIACCF